ncbi:MAG: DNA repair exonuclease [Pirellulaceae bacterium]|nr:DNA repair exonuclease [Pirellulaceae bacterium]
MFSFIHAADLHLDSPLVGLEAYEGAPIQELRAAPRRSLENLVELAIEKKVDFIVLAGDIYDGDWQDHNTGLFFRRQMARLNAAEIPVVMISGNHDAQSKISKSLKLPENVITLSASHPETAKHSRLAELGVAIHGQSFATQAVTANLAREYPAKNSGLYNIGVLHTSLEGAEGHEPYAPCKLEDLLQKDYDYWALGHIHKRQVLNEDPWIVFSGNIQGRHIRESGAKGCYLVTVDDQRKTTLEFCPLDVFRWETCQVHFAGTEEHSHKLMELLQNELTELRKQHPMMPLALRIVVLGATPYHDLYMADQTRWLNEIRGLATDLFSDLAWIEKVKFQTRPFSAPQSSPDISGPWEDIAWCLQQARQNPDFRNSLLQTLEDLIAKLPDELRTGSERIELDREELFEEWLMGAESILTERLSRGGHV